MTCTGTVTRCSFNNLPQFTGSSDWRLVISHLSPTNDQTFSIVKRSGEQAEQGNNRILPAKGRFEKYRQHTVGSKIILALELIRVKKLIPNAVL